MTTEMETISFEGRDYLGRRVVITTDDGTSEILVASERLRDALLLPDGEFKSDEAAALDESIACYVPHDAMSLRDESLAELVENNFYDMQELSN